MRRKQRPLRNAATVSAVRVRVAIPAIALPVALFLFSAAAQAAAPSQLWHKCPSGLGAAQCDIPRGIAADPDTGHLYVADQSNDRINEFTAWGEFVKAWGQDVVRHGSPDDVPGLTEQQEVTVKGTVGLFVLQLEEGSIREGTVTEPLPFDAPAALVEAELNALPAVAELGGSISVTGGPGDATGSHPYLVTFGGGLQGDDARLMGGQAVPGAGDSFITVATKVEGGGNFEVCRTASNPEDVCKPGSRSAGPGALASPQGIALDSSGDIYVAEFQNSRVQKFAPSGEFLLMFGGGVNKTKVEEGAPEAQRNRCPVDPGDVCQGGVTGSGKGQFEPWLVGSLIAAGPGDVIYVGDKNRVQTFNTQGEYLGDLPDPEGVLVGGRVQALAVAPAGAPHEGRLFLALGEREDVIQLSPTTGKQECATPLKVKSPEALAVDGHGSLYAVDGGGFGSGNVLFVREFQSGCPTAPVLSFAPQGFEVSTGIAANTVTEAGGVGLYLSNAESGNSFVRAYGPPPDKWPPPVSAPSIDQTYAISVATESAVVKARINPHFWEDTRYFVQYGTAPCSLGGCAEQPAAPGSLLTTAKLDADLTTAGVVLTGLEPDTTYHYRFVAQSSGGGPTLGPERTIRTFPLAASANTECPNQALRIDASAKLPDCRAFEMVSPVEKTNDVESAGLDQTTPDGEKLTYSTAFAAFADPQSAPAVSQYVATRDPVAGWSSRSITPPRGSESFYFPPLANWFKAFSPDLCQAWFLQDTDLALAPGAPAGFPNLYKLDLCGEAGYTPLTTKAPTNPELAGLNKYFPSIKGFSADGGLSVFEANAKLTGDAVAGPDTQLYGAYGPGNLRLISVLPNSSAATGDSSLGSATGYALGTGDTVRHAISDDGSRVFWTNGSGLAGGKIYLRLNPTQPQSTLSGGKCTQPARACTVAVSESVSSSAALFITAAADGSRTIFRIEDGALEGNLYEFDADKAIAYEAEPASLIAEGVSAVMGASEDAIRLYFTSTEDLGAGPNPEGDLAVPGRHNLYLYRRGQGFAFIGTLSSTDLPLGGIGTEFPSPLAVTPGMRTSRVSTDGRYAAFTSRASLTGYDNADAASGQPDAEVYLYDAEGERLLCASCNPSGARPAGRKVGAANNGAIEYWDSATIPGWESEQQPSRALSDDGMRLFFESYDALVPQDSNGTGDVYQWEAPDTGDCDREDAGYSAPNGGCLSLISFGQSANDSKFLDASADGSDVFIETQSSLLPQDIGLTDIYDARVDGGFPAAAPAPPACEGEACQSPPDAPTDPAPASSAFEGAGNVVEPIVKPCPKGKVRKHGKCVKKRKGKRQRRAAHHRRAAR
jgi:DNA-binding beta-propeller fold protein YncE